MIKVCRIRFALAKYCFVIGTHWVDCGEQSGIANLAHNIRFWSFRNPGGKDGSQELRSRESSGLATSYILPLQGRCLYNNMLTNDDDVGERSNGQERLDRYAHSGSAAGIVRTIETHGSVVYLYSFQVTIFDDIMRILLASSEGLEPQMLKWHGWRLTC